MGNPYVFTLAPSDAPDPDNYGFFLVADSAGPGFTLNRIEVSWAGDPAALISTPIGIALVSTAFDGGYPDDPAWSAPQPPLLMRDGAPAPTTTVTVGPGPGTHLGGPYLFDWTPTSGDTVRSLDLTDQGGFSVLPGHYLVINGKTDLHAGLPPVIGDSLSFFTRWAFYIDE